MKKISYPCPCGGRIKWKKGKVVVEGVNCGVLDVEFCEKCGEEYLPEESLKIVENKLKDAGLWNVERKKVSFWRSGGSVVLRIPVRIANALSIKAKTKADIYPEGRNKLIIEL